MIRQPRFLLPRSARASCSLSSCSLRGELRRSPQNRGGEHRSREHRSGLTLLEILLASVILATALAVLAQQNSTGVQAALRSQLETEAAVRCQSLLNRLTAQSLPSTGLQDQAMNEDGRWRWSATVKSSQFEGLSLLTVVVYHDGVNRRISTFSLSRLVRNDRQETPR